VNLDSASEAEVIEEMAQHMDDRYEELLASGIAEEECCRRVLAELDRLNPLVRGARLVNRPPAPASTFGIPSDGKGYMSGVIHDLKMAVRLIRMQPWFSLMVIGMLALGIAGNAAIFSIFNGLFLRPLPFVESERLVELDETAPKWSLEYVGVSNPDFYEWRKSNSTFDGMAFFTGASYNLSDGSTVERVAGAQVTRDMLDVLGLEPMIGRNFKPEEDRPGGAKAVLLNYDLWQRMFGGDRQVLGRVLKLDEQPYMVIGILPRGAVFPDRVDLWTPLAADPNRPSGYYLNGVARLKRGVSIAQAQADLLRIHKAIIPAGRKVNEVTSPIVKPLRDRYLGDFKIISRVLFGAVAMVLLIACVNIAALMMVRGSSRSREIAIRNAMGASPSRITAQLLTENLVFATAGAAFGVPLGAACLRAVVSRMPNQMPQWITFSLDWRFAIFCVVVTGAAALVFGLAPVLQASHLDIRETLQNAATRATATRGRRAALGTFVVCEIALALILSTSAGLLVQAFRRVLKGDPGFRPESVLTFGTSLPDASYEKPEQKIAYYENLLERLRQLPGVKAAGATSAPPLSGKWGGQFEVDGGGNRTRDENPVVLRVAATPGYFDAIGSTLLAGRTFEQRDCRPDSQLVVMVNETFAKHFWPGESPIGRRIRYPGGKDRYEVIGLLRDERHDGLDRDVTPSVFLPYSTALLKAVKDDLRSLRLVTFILRGSTDPNSLVRPAREIVRQIDPDVPMYAVETMRERLDQSLWARRAYSWLFGAFAVIAVFLAAAGVYGMVSYSVAQRTQEIGIRVALGARPAQVLRQVLLSGMALVSIGVAAGLLGALWGMSLLRSLLFGVSSRDPFIYLAVAIGLIGIGLLANFLPARRAAAVDPIRALHFE
jgi:putative ABC transport system permease protein